MTTIAVPPLSMFVCSTTIGTMGTPNPLDTKAVQKFRGLRGVFKITVTNWTKTLEDPPEAPYYFSFIMKGGTGRYRTDPGRPFYYINNTAVDNSLVYLETKFANNTTYNTLMVTTKEDTGITYLFTFSVSISQTSFPTIQRIDDPSILPITGRVDVKVENYHVNYM